jgi:N-acetylmuramoyl-L-alanine amidase-like protein
MATLLGESRRGTRITLVAIHTNEGNNPPHLYPDRTAENLRDWLNREIAAKRYKSYHAIGDDDSIAEHCPEVAASWSMRSGNLRSLNFCLTGWARWSRAEWLEHSPMLMQAAGWVRQKCHKYGIPMTKINGRDIRAGQWGICGHKDWTESDLDDSDHTDPGPNFPWDYFIALVRGEDDDMATAKEVWDFILPDPYVDAKGTKAQPKPAASLLAWAATHAAFAREQALRNHADIAAIRSAVIELAAQADLDVNALVQQMDTKFREALKDGLLDVQIRVTDTTEGKDTT